MRDIRWEHHVFETTTIESSKCGMCLEDGIDYCSGCDNAFTIVDYKKRPYQVPVRKLDYDTCLEVFEYD